MRCAAVDIGTNSCRLLIADAGPEGLCPLRRENRTTRVGEGFKEAIHIRREIMERNLECLIAFEDTIKKTAVESYRVVATSALREAVNREEFLGMVEEKTMLQIEVIGSEEEARLGYLGMSRGLSHLQMPLMADLGGGSLELIKEGVSPILLSLPLGAVRAMEQDMGIIDIKAALRPLAVYKDTLAPYPLVVVGGTASSLVAIKYSLQQYDPSLVHGQVLKREEIADIYNMLERMSLKVRRRLPGLQPERADIITWGARIILLLMDMLEIEEIIVSESDLLEGVIWNML